GDLAREWEEGFVVRVRMGSARQGNGMLGLMKALRREAPGGAETAARLGVAPQGEPLAHVMKTMHTAHAGKLSLARILRGSFPDGSSVTAPSGETNRMAGLSRLMGQTAQQVPVAQLGDTAAMSKLDAVKTGDAVSIGKPATALARAALPEPVMALAVRARDRKDDVKLSAAIQKLLDEDRSLTVEQNPELGEMILRGQGEMHLRV